MKPISKPLLYAFAFILYSTLFYGCGKGTGTQPVAVLLPPNSPPQLVQLNDTWQQVFPSESVKLGEDYKFTVPSAVNIVSGEAQCWNGSSFYPCNGIVKLLRARLLIGADMCEYQADISSATVLSLRDCSRDFSQSVTLPKDTVIELQNYDAPGQLLEVKFYLSR